MRLFEMFEGKIDEVNMSPGALADFAESEFAQSMTAGFETELIVPDNSGQAISIIIADAIGMPVKYNKGYHGVKRGTGYFILEPDSSIETDNPKETGLELVSPPMPFAQTLEYLDKVFNWANSYGCRTDSSTGFHMGISIPNQSSKNVDYLKFILFLGDEYVLKDFGREDNEFAQNMNTVVSGNIPSDIQLEKMFKSMRSGMNSKAAKILSNKLTSSNDKYVSVNIKPNYIEVRSAGGVDYIKNVDKIKLTLMRYVRAMGIAADPEAEKNEYAKKVYKLLSKNFSKNYGSNNIMALFSRYSSNQITQDQLIAEIHKIRQDKAANQYWKKPNAKIAVPKAGQGTEYFIVSNGKLLHKVVAKTRRDAEVIAEKWIAENPNPIYDYRVVLANSKMGQQATVVAAAEKTKEPKSFKIRFSLNGESFTKTIKTSSKDVAMDWMYDNFPKAEVEAVTPVY
jgi:hypothetical protein